MKYHAKIYFSLSQWFKRFILLNFVFLIIMSVFRIFFVLRYGEYEKMKYYWTDLSRALFMGLRFDLSTLSYLAIPIILILFFRYFTFFKKLTYLNFFQKICRIYYLFLFFLVCLILFIDSTYYSYFQDHINSLVFGFFEDDTMALIRTFSKNYSIMGALVSGALFVLLLHYLLVKIFPLYDRDPLDRDPLVRNFLDQQGGVSFLVQGMVFVMVSLLARGSLGMFPLSLGDTVISREPFINVVAFSGIQSLFRAIKLRRTQATQWNSNASFLGYTNLKSAFSDYYNITPEQVPNDPVELMKKSCPPNPWAEQNRPHVIVILMESMGGHWLDFQSKEFNIMGGLEKHFKEDFHFKNFLPATNATIGSIDSAMNGTPHRPTGAFLSEGPYMQVPLPTSPAIAFKQAGYKTRLVYGGNTGWRDINKYAHFQGFDISEGDVDVENLLGPVKFRHDWGIYDEDFFNYLYQTLLTAETPQMVLGLTTTNHPPYEIPSTYKPDHLNLPPEVEKLFNVDKKMAKQRFSVFQYSNQKLSDFIEKIKSGPLKDKVLLAVTGDHGFLLINYSDEELLNKWKVPLYIYLPQQLKELMKSKTQLSTFGSHNDIFPTMTCLALSKIHFSALGHNLFDLNETHEAVHFSMLSMNQIGAAQITQTNDTNLYRWKDPLHPLLLEKIPSLSGPFSEFPEWEALSKEAKKYRALLSMLDFYFLLEKERGKEKSSH